MKINVAALPGEMLAIHYSRTCAFATCKHARSGAIFPWSIRPGLMRRSQRHTVVHANPFRA